MPPRYSYWTIIAGGLPTAFRAAERDDILPTFNRIQEKHPDAEMKWFARGKLWESPEAARADTEKRRRPPEGGRPSTGGRSTSGPSTGSQKPDGRGRDWRPGGEHRDPRQRFIDAKKERNQDRRQQRFDRKQGPAPPKPNAKAEAGHYVPKPRRWERPAPPKPRSGEGGPVSPKRRSRGGGH